MRKSGLYFRERRHVYLNREAKLRRSPQGKGSAGQRREPGEDGTGRSLVHFRHRKQHRGHRPDRGHRHASLRRPEVQSRSGESNFKYHLKKEIRRTKSILSSTDFLHVY